MGKNGIWSNDPWDPSGGRARRGRTELAAGTKLLFLLLGLVTLAIAGAIAWLT